MATVTRDIGRILTLVRDKIRDRGFTQLEVQAKLGWGRSYISQLLTKQKQLRVDQLLTILDVLGVAPGDFFAELYPQQPDPFGLAPAPTAAGELAADYRRLRALLRGLVQVLVDKDVVSVEEIAAAAVAVDSD